MHVCPGLFGIDIGYLARGRGIKPQKVGRRKKSGRNGGGQEGFARLGQPYDCGNIAPRSN